MNARKTLLILSLFLAACGTATPATQGTGGSVGPGSETPAYTRPSESPSPTSPTETAQPPTAAPVTTVGYVTVGSANTSMLTAITRAANDFGWNYQAAPNGSVESIRSFAESGVAIVVVEGGDLAADTVQLAVEFPGTYFINTNPAAIDVGALPGNLLVFGGGGARVDQIGFVAGLIAGLITENRIVTMIGYPGSVAGLSYRNGFLHGVRYSCPRCRVLNVDVADLTGDPAAVEAAARYEAFHSDVFFAAAGGAGDEALAAAAQAGGWVIGSGSDVYLTRFEGGSAAGAERVVTSIYFDDAAAVYSALALYHAGSLHSGRQPLSAATGALALAPFRAAADQFSVPEQASLQAALLQLQRGELDTGIDPATGEER